MSEPLGYQRLFAELKRRNVFRVAAVYGATGFLVLQAADLLAAGLALPEVVLRTATFLVLLGFPIALVLAWAYDRTPEGVQRTDPAASGELEAIAAQPAAKRWPSGLLALAGVVALAGGAWWVGRSTAPGGADAAEGSAGVDRGQAQAARFVAAEDAEDSRRTLAVLPFDNLSGDSGTEPFVVGVHDDLLTQLSKIGALRVTSRTSVKEYRDTEKSIPQIAGELGVSSVLEGGVQRAGSQVRINVQLIDPATDEHLWAETYDAELTAENVFEIQSRIARSVADALEAELSPAEDATLDVVGTRDLEALAAYHAGREAWYARGTARTDSIAIASFERAVEIDPEFADAWAGLAMILSWRAQARSDVDRERIREAVARAGTLAPESPETELGRGFEAYYVERDFDEALAHFRTADRLRPSDSGVAQAIAYILRRQGDWEGSLGELRRAVELDPRNPDAYAALGETLAWTRRYEAAERVVDRGLLVDPEYSKLVELKLLNLVALDRDTDRAKRYAESLPPAVRDDYPVLVARTWIAWLGGDVEEALRIARSLVPADPQEELVRQLLTGLMERSRGSRDAARAAGKEVERIAERTVVDRGGWQAAFRAIGHGLQEDTATAIELANEARSLAAGSGDALTDAVVRSWSALALANVGAFDDAADALLALADVPVDVPNVAQLRLAPFWEGLRGSPEYPAVLAAFEAAEAEAAKAARRDAGAGN
jgi:TolB-like protein/Tfp pilus assembly protein PilF